MRHEIRLDLEIVFSSRWHCGSGEGTFVADRLIRRDARNRPFIPAATLKGVIRQSCEKLSRTLKFPEPSDPHQTDLSRNRGFVPFDQMISPIDRLFGTKFQHSGLFFRDARLKNDVDMGTFYLNRVARYRVLRTAKDKHLFTTEYTRPAILQTRIDGRHNHLASLDEDFPPYAYCLLIAGILLIDRIGGDKSTGSGWMDKAVRFESAQYNRSPINMDDVFELLNPQDYADMRGAS